MDDYMTLKIDINDLPDFDVADYLDEVGAIFQYLALAMADGDPGLLEAALADIARMSHPTSSLKPRTRPVWGDPPMSFANWPTTEPSPRHSSSPALLKSGA
jgi:hypothetical protein